MAKNRNEEEVKLIEAAIGIIAGFIHLLVKLANEMGIPSGALYRLATPEGEKTLVAAIKAFLAEVAKFAGIFKVRIGGTRKIAEVVATSGYTGFDQSILQRCTLTEGPECEVTIELFGIEHFDHDPSDAEIEAEYIRLGLDRPDPDHAIHFGEQKQAMPVEGHPVIFYLKNPVPDGDGNLDVLWLLTRVIDSHHPGLPLGNLTSQLLVNIYMNEFDQFVKHTVKARHYIRYADDFITLHHDRDYLLRLLPQMHSFLHDRLKLNLHPDKVFIKTIASGVDFLGWVHFPDHRVLRTATKRRMAKRINEGNQSSYIGLLSHGNTEKLRTLLSF